MEIDVESFLRHAREQEASYEEFRACLKAEICRAIQQEKDDLLSRVIWDGGKGEGLSMFIRDPYVDIKNGQDVKEAV